MPYHKDPKKVGVMDTRIKFGGRTVVMTVYVNTEEDANHVGERVNDAAKGPKLRMAFTGARLVTGADAMAAWSAIVGAAGGEQTAIKFGGRTIILSVCVNTDEEAAAVVLRTQEAANGPHKRMAAIGVNVATGAAAAEVWMEMQRTLAAAGAEQMPGGE